MEENRKKPGTAFLVMHVTFLVLDAVVIALIAALFLMRPGSGERVKPTISAFSTSTDGYYEDNEAYRQTMDVVRTYPAAERPD